MVIVAMINNRSKEVMIVHLRTATTGKRVSDKPKQTQAFGFVVKIGIAK